MVYHAKRLKISKNKTGRVSGKVLRKSFIINGGFWTPHPISSGFVRFWLAEIFLRKLVQPGASSCKLAQSERRIDTKGREFGKRRCRPVASF